VDGNEYRADVLARLGRIEDKVDQKVGRGELFGWLSFSFGLMAVLALLLTPVGV
jgi:hypothetical protein